jgi:hypothetical protein
MSPDQNKQNQTKHVCLYNWGIPVYPHVQLSEWEKWWSIHGPIHLGTPCSKPVHPVMRFFFARKSTIYLHKWPIKKKNMDHKVTRHSQPAIHRGFHRPHSSGALLPATGAEQGIEPRPLWHNSNQFPDSRHHWGAQRKFPAVALTLVILGGYGWIMSWTEKPHDPTGLPCCANEEQVS